MELDTPLTFQDEYGETRILQPQFGFSGPKESLPFIEVEDIVVEPLTIQNKAKAAILSHPSKIHEQVKMHVAQQQSQHKLTHSEQRNKKRNDKMHEDFLERLNNPDPALLQRKKEMEELLQKEKEEAIFIERARAQCEVMTNMMDAFTSRVSRMDLSEERRQHNEDIYAKALEIQIELQKKNEASKRSREEEYETPFDHLSLSQIQ